MAKYKITCTDMNYIGRTCIGNKYRGVEFQAVAYTDDEDFVNQIQSDGFHHGGVPIFQVEEVEEAEK